MKNKLFVIVLLGCLSLLNFHLTASAQPVTTTLPATNITATNATLNGTVITGGYNTTAYFEYGTTTGYGGYGTENAGYGPIHSVPGTTGTSSLSDVMTNLLPGTLYHFVLLAGNSGGSGDGSDLTFTTSPGVPSAVTTFASGIAESNVVLNGVLTTGGLGTSAYFQYGLTTSYGSFSVTNTVAAANTMLSLTNIISSLLPGTSYHFQLVASNSAGIALGGDRTFTTLAPPVATTLPATSIGATTATFNGSVAPNGSVTVAFFQYGLTTNYGSYSATNTLAATNNATLSLFDLVSGLSSGTNYHFQLVASNSAGIALGGDLTFATPATPVVTTLPATGIAATNATLNGTVNPIGSVASGYFQYGLTTNYGSESSFVALPATNATLTLPGLLIDSLRGVAGANWTQTGAPGTNWASIASSADGTQLAAVVSGGGIYTSTNSGTTWTQTSASFDYWQSISSSADGTHLAAVAKNDGIYFSTNSGLVWTKGNAPSGFWDWISIASSADGTRLAMALYPFGVYTSTNSGATWTQTSAAIDNCYSIASSADGTRLAAVGNGGGIYTSADGGVTWSRTSAPSANWTAIASSSDGTQLTAVVTNGGIYVSANGGLNWTQTTAPVGNWYSVASSTDGARLAAAAYSGGIYTSADGGVTWTPTGAPGINWNCIASSADGTQLAAVVSGGGIYTSAGQTGNLAPGTLYHYRAAAFDSVGTSFGGDLTFTTSAGAPTATTLAASGATAAKATLNGTLTTGGLNTSVYFQYGLTANYGSYSATNTLAANNVSLSVTNLISGLSPNTTYHFQLVARNSAGASAGADLTFAISATVPTVATLPATSIGQTNATLNGTVDPNGLTAWAYFQYGLTTSYGNSGSVTTLSGTNITQTLPGLVINSLGSAVGANWTSDSAPSVLWQSIASSADGTRLAAVANGSGIYTSTNSGATWTQSSAPTASWFAVASSADGTRLAAVAKNTGIYTSTNSGATWTLTSAPTGLYWYSIASSVDGTRLVASVYGGGIYTSTDGGNTWTQTSAPANHWYSLASSADGTRLAALVYGGNIYTSANGGGTWTPTSASSGNWGAIASSSDGTRLVAAVNGGGIYTSTDSGVTWTQTSAPGANWQSIVSSADGTRLAAVIFGGGIYTSTDGGVTWTSTGAPSANWAFIAASADGTKLGAVVYGGGIETSTGTATSLVPGSTYHFRLVSFSSAGYSYGNDLTFTTLTQAVNFGLNGATKLTGGAFQFSFTNASGLGFTVLSTTNLTAPLTNWTVLGAPVEAPPGQYKFTDLQATNARMRFYRVTSP